MPKFEWNFSDIFTSDEDGRIDESRAKFREETQKFVDKWRGRDDYLNDLSALAEAMSDYEVWITEQSVPADYFYFWLRSEQEQDNPKIKAQFGKSEQVYRESVKEIQFFDLRIAKLSEEMQRKVLASQELAPYRHHFERLFASAKHQLGEEAEQVMLMQSKSAYSSWVSMTSEFLGKEEAELEDVEGKIALRSYAEIVDLTAEPKKQIRDAAAQALNEILKKHVDVAEAELNAVLNHKEVTDSLRKYARPDSSRHLSDDIDTDSVDAMLAAVEENFAIAHDYYKLKAKMLGQEKLEYHERNVPVGAVVKKYDYDEAVTLLRDVLAELDNELVGKYDNLIASGRVDVFPRKGKRHGAFCAYFSKSLPTYVMLNHSGRLNDVLTLAHEMGHALNAELMRVQSGINFGTPMSTAEVASTFVEDFVLQRLLREANREEKISLLMQKLNDDVSTIFRQVACYRFEQELHAQYREKSFLPKEEIGKIFHKHMGAYLGDAVELSEGSENWWVYWSHIRTYFYVYSYASGLLISKAMQAAVAQEPKFILKVKEFLAAGSSKSPRELFADLGIDITQKRFWLDGIGKTRELLAQLENLV